MRFAVATAIAVFSNFVAASHQPGQSGGTAIPITKRTWLVNKADGRVDFDALDSHVASIRTKIARGFDNYAKNTGMTHPAAIMEQDLKQDGAGVGLTTHGMNLWYGEISIGTPPKSFTVHFDTSTGDLYVPLSSCTSCGDRNRWDPTASSSQQNLKRPFLNKFADGSAVVGDVYADTVTIAGFTANLQAFGAATQYTANFDKSVFPPDGALGMAFYTLATTGDVTLFERLVVEDKVSNPVFSFKFNSTGGELYIGGSNRELYIGDFAFAKVTRQAYWEVNMESLWGNDEPLLYDVSAIIDTGASLIAGHPSQVSDLHKKLGGKPHPDNPGYYTFPCGSIPRVSLTFGQRSFPISAATLSRGPVSGSTDCLSGIIDSGMGASFWIIGDVFLQNVYTSFDVYNLQVGFAELAPEAQT